LHALKVSSEVEKYELVDTAHLQVHIEVFNANLLVYIHDHMGERD
jgi:hypothetical protein